MIGFVLATLMWTFGEIIDYPTLFFAYPAQAGPPEAQGRYLGASNALYGLGSALGPIALAARWFGARPKSELSDPTLKPAEEAVA